MEQSKMISAKEMAKELGVSNSFAYKAIKKMNLELKANGYFTICGKVSRAFYQEKFYGIKEAI